MTNTPRPITGGNIWTPPDKTQPKKLNPKTENILFGIVFFGKIAIQAAILLAISYGISTVTTALTH